MGKSAADQTNRLALVVIVGAIMSWPSCCRFAPSLRILLGESSKFDTGIAPTLVLKW